jgi:signal transduction histidine kinase
LRELALHILDLIENAVRAGAGVVAVAVEEDQKCDLLRLAVEDDGPGLGIPESQATDPFCTTKGGKPRRRSDQRSERGRGRDDIGLGLSLLRFRCEQAGGELALARSPLGGLAVQAAFRFSHVDRSPLGDLASTLSGVVATNPGLELRLRLRRDSREWRLSSLEAARGLVAARPGRPGAGGPTTMLDANPLAVAKRVCEQIKEGLQALQIKE